ncbi:MAG: hypothetical protein SFX73_39280 [Kofleriaceae bacterium]|nr:hypothetical protein [Kofleriaceae bacterium]
MTGDEYLYAQVQPLLQPGEQVLQTAYMRRQPGLLMQMLLVGGLLLFLMTKAYFAVLTNRRLIFIRTKMGFWKGGPQQQNLGIEQYDVRALTKCTTSGIANNRSMTFHMSNGPAQTLRISPWFKQIRGTKDFLEQVPNLINSGQLAQMAGGALPPGAPQQQMQQPMGQPPMQQPQYQQQPQMQMQQPATFQPGMRVLVAPGDGQRYQATIVAAAQGQYQCTMPNGQAYWFPAQQVSAS